MLKRVSSENREIVQRKASIFLRKKLIFEENSGLFRSQRMRKFSRKKRNSLYTGREIIYYDIIKLLILSSQSRDFHKFVSAINCCSDNTSGFHGIFFAKLFSRTFPLIKNAKYVRKISAFFRKSFRSLKPQFSPHDSMNKKKFFFQISLFRSVINYLFSFRILFVFLPKIENAGHRELVITI